MSNKNNVLPFPTKTDATLLEFRQTVSELIVLEAQLFKMLEEVDLIEGRCQELMDKHDRLMEELRKKELIDLTMEVVQKQHDD